MQKSKKVAKWRICNILVRDLTNSPNCHFLQPPQSSWIIPFWKVPKNFLKLCRKVKSGKMANLSFFFKTFYKFAKSPLFEIPSIQNILMVHQSTHQCMYASKPHLQPPSQTPCIVFAVVLSRVLILHLQNRIRASHHYKRYL